jgi:pimeloyl-ACP methyl ester carboxylesterase
MHLVDLKMLDAEVEPEPVFEDDMFFLLFTRSNPTTGQRITWEHASIVQSNFRVGGQVRFLIHGWGGSASTSTENIFNTRDFLEFGDFNVIVVDWSVGAGANYVTSRNRVGSAGAVVARLIDFFHENNYADHSNVNIVGHSLGSHVAGHAGKNVQGGKINAIFGTDPAGKKYFLKKKL